MSPLIDASTFKSFGKHPALGRISNAGYRLEYRIEFEPSLSRTGLNAQVLQADSIVAKATFKCSPETVAVHWLWVEISHRRQGLATAMCVFAEYVFDRPLKNRARDGLRPEEIREIEMFWFELHQRFLRSAN